MINKRKVFSIHINKKLKNKPFLLLRFGCKGKIRKKDISFDLEFNKSIDDKIDVVFELKEEIFILLLREWSLDIFTKLLNKSEQR